jgi:hypothetical protein
MRDTLISNIEDKLDCEVSYMILSKKVSHLEHEVDKLSKINQQYRDDLRRCEMGLREVDEVNLEQVIFHLPDWKAFLVRFLLR